MEDFSRYAHSPVHLAVLRGDHSALLKIIGGLPRLPMAGQVNTEVESIAAELEADEFSAVIDGRDVPGRETPLHLAVRLRDARSVKILMVAGADWSLQNQDGWNALQEAVCTKQDHVAMIIAQNYQPHAWAKWCRRLPRIIASMGRIRDFYMEISFNFESSVIPFIGRIAPSDTYRIWKRGSNLRADMTLTGFDGFRIQRSDQTYLFLGDGYSREDGSMPLPPGSFVALTHKDKEITNALEGAGALPTEAEVAQDIALMSQTNTYRPGIDVTQAELVPHLNWRRQEKTELVGNWKAKIYDMHNVMVSVKSRRVPGAMTDEELFTGDDDGQANGVIHDDELNDVLTADERKQLDSALHMDDSADPFDDNDHSYKDCHENGFGGASGNSDCNGVGKDKKGWFSWRKKGTKSTSDILSENGDHTLINQRHSPDSQNNDIGDTKKGDRNGKKKKKKDTSSSESKLESEYKKGLTPVLWLTPDFPLKTEEFLPLLDILANKVKAVRRLRELLTTKLPQGTFPVKAAISVVPTIRVIVTFTKFKELQPVEEFSTPLSSPTHFQVAKADESSSWISWVRRKGCGENSESCYCGDDVNPFDIPSDYTWIDVKEKKCRSKAKMAKTKNIPVQPDIGSGKAQHMDEESESEIRSDAFNAAELNQAHPRVRAWIKSSRYSNAYESL
ncbi:Ankyrin repeat domain-containing protein [Drosera capensis]